MDSKYIMAVGSPIRFNPQTVQQQLYSQQPLIADRIANNRRHPTEVSIAPFSHGRAFRTVSR